MDILLYNAIQETDEKIENELLSINRTGIFFAPELYINFQLGMFIYNHRNKIFLGCDEIEWKREQSVNGSGPIDIIFKTEKYTVLIETKLRGEIDTCFRDIMKLKNLEVNYQRFFCLLSDKFKNGQSRKILLSEKFNNEIELIGEKIFPTWNNWYSTPVYCELLFYKIN